MLGRKPLRRGQTPVRDLKAISAAYYFACGIRTDDTVACWGSNSHGEATPPSGTFKAISGGFDHTCAIRTNDTVACWGDNYNGQSTPPR